LEIERRNISSEGLLRQSSFKNHQKEPAVPERVFWLEESTMRKVVSLLDEEQRLALLELADFGTAVFSAGLIVAVLQGFVSLMT
jgi:hypothetical protein